MPHDHCHHHHSKDESNRALLFAIGLNLLLTFAQLIGGFLAGSLALVADALHNLNDAASLGLALFARVVARRPADELRTFGYRKAETIGALISATALLLIGFYLLYEALLRFIQPQEVLAWPVIAIATLALVVDLGTAWLTFRAQDGSLNLRAALLHNLADAIGSIAVIAAGVLILLFEWHYADLLAAIGISAYVLWHSYFMMKDAIRVLMASVPDGIALSELMVEMKKVAGVTDVHHVHLWQVDERQNAVEAHIVVATESFAYAEGIKNEVKRVLREQYSITHSTLELESELVAECLPEHCHSDKC